MALSTCASSEDGSVCRGVRHGRLQTERECDRLKRLRVLWF
jgi:hypothetical protein